MFKTVSFETKQQRITICESCESFSKSFGTCASCGCYMPAKASFADTECPESKWTKSAPGESLINTIEEMILESWNKM